MDGPRIRARRYFAPVLTDVGLYDVWKTVQRVLTRAASLEGAMDAMRWYGSGGCRQNHVTRTGLGDGDDLLRVPDSASAIGISCCGFPLGSLHSLALLSPNAPTSRARRVNFAQGSTVSIGTTGIPRTGLLGELGGKVKPSTRR